MPIQSLGESLYFLIFIDDFRRNVWIYFIKTKYETFSMFKEFKVEAEKLIGKFVKILRSDGEGEYDSKEYDHFCKEHCIKKQITTKYTPQ